MWDVFREYLTGFTKRKNERRKRAKEEEIALLKQKKKSLKEQVENLMKSHLIKNIIHSWYSEYWNISVNERVAIQISTS